jgi:hypothetical protein
MNRVDRFQSLISEPATPPLATHDELVQPLRDLALALTAKAIGAAVKASDDKRRYHLMVWPLHRPAYRSILVSVSLVNGRVVVPGNPTHWFTTTDEFTEWLEGFVQRSEFRSTLEDLRAQAAEPVDGRLEQLNGMATIVEITLDQQARLDEQPHGIECQMDLRLREGEAVNDEPSFTMLNAAGLRFEVRQTDVQGRIVRLRLVRV